MIQIQSSMWLLNNQACHFSFQGLKPVKELTIYGSLLCCRSKDKGKTTKGYMRGQWERQWTMCGAYNKVWWEQNRHYNDPQNCAQYCYYLLNYQTYLWQIQQRKYNMHQMFPSLNTVKYKLFISMLTSFNRTKCRVKITAITYFDLELEKLYTYLRNLNVTLDRAQNRWIVNGAWHCWSERNA